MICKSFSLSYVKCGLIKIARYNKYDHASLKAKGVYKFLRLPKCSFIGKIVTET